jgi:hypothetical protein
MCCAAAIDEGLDASTGAPDEERNRCLECRKPIERGQAYFRFRAGDIHADCFREPPPDPEP